MIVVVGGCKFSQPQFRARTPIVAEISEQPGIVVDAWQQGSQLVLQLDVIEGPELSGAAPECREPLDAQLVIAEMNCANGVSVPIRAEQVFQRCETELSRVTPARSTIELPAGCGPKPQVIAKQMIPPAALYVESADR